MSDRRIAARVEWLVVIVTLCSLLLVHARWIFVHFSSDGYLVDSGWFAYLLGSGDPLLINPSGVNALSYYAHHLSPYIFLFGTPLSFAVGLDGIEILAVHQAVVFTLFFVALCLLVARAPMSRSVRAAALLSAVAIGALSNILFQAAAYPHFEVALLALSALALAGALGGSLSLFVFSLAVLPLVREDGGLYAAWVCCACMAITHGQDPRPVLATRTLAILAAAGVAFSVLSMGLKAALFPGFDAFSANFSGDAWSHVSADFVAVRLRGVATNVSTATIIAGSSALAVFDVRYLAGLLLLSPLLLLHLVSVRDEIGHFTLYYALPWLLPCAVWLAVFSRRAARRTASRAEALVILVASVLLTAPLHAVLGVQPQFWRVPVAAMSAPVADIDGMKAFILWSRTEYAHTYPRDCVSPGIAALVPNDVESDEVLDAGADLASCGGILMMRGDIAYNSLRARAEAQKFVLSRTKENVEFWTRP